MKDAKAVAQHMLDADGACAPIDVLLSVGGLSQDAYRAWRAGKLPTLDNALAPGVEEARRMLREVDAWAREAGLAPGSQAYIGTDGAASITLTVSADRELNALLHTVYRPNEHRRRRTCSSTPPSSRPPDAS